ncbi:LysR family transcriptional regulator [Defluviimonas sp. WL0002]|uniref:LysR family transcriptional regulator n=1 Tax=Albidovulum marisflavi TaxID=2984159 RepID=A0ABT2ZBI4_9RHOB|nr:LysR family transcriptional regulator [Defluviimonas sp. WL0002]MCV2868474.1 LysR family transcriptional regulator [Defluviimonas sp. WL0002]
MPQDTGAHSSRLDWNDLELILAICRAESLSGAARMLGQTHSTIFRRINAAEARTGVRFFDRFPHGYVMTDAGRAAMAHAERMENEVHALGRTILGRDENLRGRIRVTCPESFAEEHAPGMIARFCRKHPEIQIDLAPGHGAADLNRREAEVAIRATRAAPTSAFGRKICDFRFALYSSSAYLALAGRKPLPDHDFCLIEGTLGWLVPRIWKTAEQGEQRVVFQCRASRAVQNAAAEGLGLTFLPCYVGDADDRLLRVSDPIAWLDLDLWVLTHRDLTNTARVRAFMTHLYGELSARAYHFGGDMKPTDKVNLLRRGE